MGSIGFRRLILVLSVTALGCTRDDTELRTGAPDASAPDAGGSVARGPIPEKRCGDAGGYLGIYSRERVAELSDCTVLVGQIQEDSVRELEDFTGLEHVRRIEGNLNIFRSPGFRTLRGLDGLVEIDGWLAIHLNPNLLSLDGLGNLVTIGGGLRISGNGSLGSLGGLEKLQTIGGCLTIDDNASLPQSEIDALVARVRVLGKGC